jgi:two-component system, OmpR family, sensor histidine kinase SaeS
MSRLARVPPTVTAAAWAVSGAAVALAVGVLALGAADAGELVVPLAVAIGVTVVAIAASGRWLASASLRLRFVSISTFAILLGLINLAVLSALMLVSEQDARMVGVLLIYASAVAVGCGLAAARSSADAVERISRAANQMAEGDLAARAGEVGGGSELERLATDLDRMAARLDAAQQRERAVERQRRDLIVAVSHDLRTPLADLQALAEAIEDGVVADPQTVGAYARQMGASVESLARLVDDLFEFVQVDAATIEAEREQARIEQVVGWAVSACDAQATMKGLRLRTELGDAGAASCSPRLTRVLQNLLQNAIRHTPADGTVVVRARQADDGVELEVEDTGEGIAPDAVDRVFEPFWRGDAARSSEGSGLGLALARRIVESLGGRIEVESAPARGSRFAVTLPGH